MYHVAVSTTVWSDSEENWISYNLYNIDYLDMICENIGSGTETSLEFDSISMGNVSGKETHVDFYTLDQEGRALMREMLDCAKNCGINNVKKWERMIYICFPSAKKLDTPFNSYLLQLTPEIIERTKLALKLQM